MGQTKKSVSKNQRVFGSRVKRAKPSHICASRKFWCGQACILGRPKETPRRDCTRQAKRLRSPKEASKSIGQGVPKALKDLKSQQEDIGQGVP